MKGIDLAVIGFHGVAVEKITIKFREAFFDNGCPGFANQLNEKMDVVYTVQSQTEYLILAVKMVHIGFAMIPAGVTGTFGIER